MSELINVSTSEIEPNPHRNLERYPYIEKKIEALLRSIKDVGFLEGVIGRRVGNHVQIAFGHHRVEAARRAGLKSIPIILRDLDDLDMLKFMGRENGEDYNSDFTIMLETWEAAMNTIPDYTGIGIARLLGWTRLKRTAARDAKNLGPSEVMNETAEACANAADLIASGVLKRSDFNGVSVGTARKVAQKAKLRISQFERSAKAHNVSDEKLEAAKKEVGKGAAEVMEKVASGEIATKDAGNFHDSGALNRPRTGPKSKPDMDRAIATIAKQVAKTLDGDSIGGKLNFLIKVLPENKPFMSPLETDAIDDMLHELERLEKRSARLRKRVRETMAAPLSNVTPIGT